MAKRKGTETSSFGTVGRINHDSSKFYNSKLYSTLEMNGTLIEKEENTFPDNLLNQIILSNCENMKDIPNNSLHLMITSPPYKALL